MQATFSAYSMIQVFKWNFIAEVGLKYFWTPKYPWKFQNMTSGEQEEFFFRASFLGIHFWENGFVPGGHQTSVLLYLQENRNTAPREHQQSEGRGGWNLLNLTFAPSSIRWMTKSRICPPLLIQQKQKTKDPLEVWRWRSWWLQGNITNSSKQHLLLMPVLTQSPV